MSRIGSLQAHWSHYQLVYHGDQDLALRCCVQPLVVELLDSGLVDRFYFIRYELGGPHLRLRWRCTGPVDSTSPAPIEPRLAEHARRFFAEHPSNDPWQTDKVRQVNREIRGVEPATEQEDPVFPDQSWHRAALSFEVWRYGGPERLEAALDLFSLSSLRALGFIRQAGRGSPSFQTAVVAELLSTGLALAETEDELVGLVGYGDDFFGETFEACRHQAQCQFEKHRPALVELAASRARIVAAALRGEVTPPDSDTVYWRAARQYSRNLGMPASRRGYVLASHLHLSANRLGAHNPEEAYLSRLALLAALELRRLDPETWSMPWRGAEAWIGSHGVTAGGLLTWARQQQADSTTFRSASS